MVIHGVSSDAPGGFVHGDPSALGIKLVVFLATLAFYCADYVQVFPMAVGRYLPNVAVGFFSLDDSIILTGQVDHVGQPRNKSSIDLSGQLADVSHADLSAASVTLLALLDEKQGSGELVEGLPINLTVQRGGRARGRLQLDWQPDAVAHGEVRAELGADLAVVGQAQRRERRHRRSTDREPKEGP